ncbi:PHD finger protein MALE MEIOCYTE DEATH 1-like [Pyrus ussuriensis x Pyrus communis]|uniref:PHD finger protein MALE MEIOCYTE DEATH 1-like n=1 Tax=Pyrus ussuriensis x Pyrus communis TaxID=2448454 RepID=A0A5N5FQS7_9ROSA|nr:PHD finger protein MALE MEIOCYTE DEATH 1-like [Pyrus ussuriensis x Pyrus communis]
MSCRQDVRDVAQLHIGDIGMLDYVLRSMNNVIVRNYIVCRAVNPTTRILKYMVHDLADGVKVIVEVEWKLELFIMFVFVYLCVVVLYHLHCPVPSNSGRTHWKLPLEKTTVI